MVKVLPYIVEKVSRRTNETKPNVPLNPYRRSLSLKLQLAKKGRLVSGHDRSVYSILTYASTVTLYPTHQTTKEKGEVVSVSNVTKGEGTGVPTFNELLHQAFTEG